MSILRYGKKLLAQGGVLMGGGGKGGGGGGGQQVTQQSNQYTSLSPWAQPYVTSILGAGQSQVFQTDPTSGQITGINPYNAYGSLNAQGGQYGLTPSDQAAANAAVAGFTPLQQQAYQGAGNLNLPNQFGPATGAALQGTGQALTAGQNYQQMATNPYATAAYMNPYIQQSLAPQLQLLAQQTGIQGAQQQSAATQAGAFGGSRSALQNALTQQAGNLAAQNAIAQGYNTAFNQAQQAQQFGANLGLQGSQAGIQGAGQLGQLGTSQLAAQQGILGLQNQFGGQQQQQAQNVINAGMTNYQTAQQYPMTQLSQLKNLISGIPVSDVTSTAQQAQPSTATQLAGLGTAGVAGLALASQASKAEGGVIKGYAGGGIAALNRKALLDPTSMSPQTLARSTQDGAIAQPVSGIAQAIQLADKVQSQNASALSQPAPQGTIMDELKAKAGQMDQAEAMQDMIPKAIAVLKHKMEVAVKEGDVQLAKRYASELQQLTAMAEAPTETPSAPAPEGIQQLSQVQQVAPDAAQQQGIDSAPSGLPEQTMAQGGIATFSSRGIVNEDEYQSKEDAEDEEMEQLFGTGSDNDFVQAVAARGRGAEISPSAGIKISNEPISVTGKGHKYEADVIKEAKRQGLPVDIALHALYKETGGLKDPELARSKAGAIGIMQLMPKTAKSLGIDPTDPMQNIQGGVTYLKQMHDKYQDPRLTLMAYNAGPGRVDKALKSREGLASLPLETRNYKKGGVSQAEYDASSESDDASMTPGIDNAYLNRSRNLVQGVKDIGSAFTNPENYDLYKMYQENIGQPFANAASKFVNETPEEQAAKFRSYSQTPNSASPTASAPALAPATTAPARTAVAPVGLPPLDPSKRVFPEAPVPMTSPTDQELGYTPQLAAIKKAQSEVQGEKQPDIYQELLADIKSRKEESKKNREQNNLLALMQAGLGMAASRNISPLGAIGEGGVQGLGALAQYRKQEGEEAKDIAAQQLGLFKYKSAADSKTQELANLEKYRAASLAAKPDVEDVKSTKFNTALSRNPQIAELNRLMTEEQKQGTLTPERYTQYQQNIQKVTQALAKQYGVTPDVAVQLAPVTDPVKVKEPGFLDKIFGSSKPQVSTVSPDRQQELNAKYNLN